VRVPNEILCVGEPCECDAPPCLEEAPGFPLAEGRLFATATLVSCAADRSRGAIYVVGGTYEPMFEAPGEPRVFPDIYCLDVQRPTAELRRVGFLRKPRTEHTTTLVRGPLGEPRLFVAGGETTAAADGPGAKQAEQSAELLVVACTCESVARSKTISLQGLHVLHSATLLPDGTVLLAGGVVASPPERFNPAF